MAQLILVEGSLSLLLVKKLIDNLEFICRSLGYITSITLDDKRPEKYTNGVAYQLNIQCKKEEKESLFRLKRKKQIAIEYINNGKRAEKKNSILLSQFNQQEGTLR